MSYNISVVLQLLLTYKYLILIPISIIEGPIISVICGFLVTLGIFNFFLVYVIMVIGDILGDAGIYYIGYKGKKLLRIFRVNEEKLEKAKSYFDDNHKKAIFASKLAHGIGFTGLIAAGAAHISYKRYFKTCALISLVQSFIMLMLGVLFGHAYVQIGKYLDYYAAIVSVLVLIAILIFIVRKYKMTIKP